MGIEGIDRIARRRLRVVLRSRLAVAGGVVLVAVILLAALAPVVAPHDPLRQNLRTRLVGPSPQHPLGTDHLGRDVLSRILHGARTSLLVGVLSVLLGASIGSLIGVVSGYSGGRLDRGVMWGVDVLMAFPALMVGLLLIVMLGSGVMSVVIAITAAEVPRFVRLARGPVLSVKQQQYVEASRAVGRSSWMICLVHVLPNVLGPLIVMATLWIGGAILIEASLSFLGLGVQPPAPTWGNMIKEGHGMLFIAPWLALFPGLAITLVVLSVNLVGDGLRDVLDPRFR